MVAPIHVLEGGLGYPSSAWDIYFRDGFMMFDGEGKMFLCGVPLLIGFTSNPRVSQKVLRFWNRVFTYNRVICL
jgi:hypothetical protein